MVPGHPRHYPGSASAGQAYFDISLEISLACVCVDTTRLLLPSCFLEVFLLVSPTKYYKFVLIHVSDQ